jgi:endonuclease-3
MQLTFDHEAEPLLPRIRDELRTFYGPQRPTRRMDPLSTLIKSVISSRTYDAVSWAAFVKLREAFPDWATLAQIPPKDIEALIAPVTHAEAKARQLPVLIRVLQARPHGLDLGFLKDHSVGQAMAWLCELPGVGPQSAAKCLNFSTLNMRALAVDTHVHRVSKRLGLTSRTGDAAHAYETLMSLIPHDWTDEELYEFHWLLKGLGQDICTDPLALCGRCPFRETCPRVDVQVRRAVVAFQPQSRSRSQTPNS